MLDERAHALLQAIVERYIQEGSPVGSKSLSSMFSLSPATIRSVMGELESVGLIHSPHTSAGRVPTPKGYRLFVDHLLSSNAHKLNPDVTLKQEVNEDLLKELVSELRGEFSRGRDFSKELNVGLEQAVDLPSSLISAFADADPSTAFSTAVDMVSELTEFAGIVMAPQRSQVFKHIDFIRLSKTRVLLVIVTPDGDVQNRILFVDKEYKESDLQRAANYFNQHFSGKSFSEVLTTLSNELDTLQTDMSKLMQAAVEIGVRGSEVAETVHIRGEHRLLGVSDLTADMDRLRQMFELFEEKTELMQLMDVSSRSQGVQIFIGGDSRLVPMEDLSVITAPYQLNGKIIGALGVIGPSRMAYQRVITIVDVTAKLLSKALSR
ncbi:Heat-inducible transcription repressor HrcA [Oligella ureolytica]|uniref:Heat-inducible transcription repressor HrcA n=1 Tax=Oligella ureolytica TaxID=90244 RepID=A0A378XEY8_9BURK|nr:heat-inducible transcriptional repressor HrcA [Oligella ureolytica]QPT40595.1 heat-inducible transcriptional repressor HrcA [Oligella ureolytica]SUA51588.1 Heat-inducible transcription repressor HrcA [Oligella ureolytica]SUA58793.1 Heat-inducible transcription repressor HrcA [Oligella ureolytica]